MWHCWREKMPRRYGEKVKLTSRGTIWLARLATALLAVPWVAWAVVRGFSLDSGDPIVSLVAFTPYAAITSPLPLLVALLFRRWAIAAVALAAATTLAVAVVPRAIADGNSNRTAGSQVVTVMSLNLDNGSADPEAIVTLVRGRGVDVLSLQELKEALPGLDREGAERILPGRAVASRASAGGSALLARRGLRLGARGDLSGSGQPRALLTLAGGKRVGVEAIHPPPPTSSPAIRAWELELRALSPRRTETDVDILAGDFNGTLDHSEIRAVLDRGYVDAADAEGAGLESTFPVGGAVPPITIDHIMVGGPDIKVRRFTTHEIPGTDHCAVIAELIVLP